MKVTHLPSEFQEALPILEKIKKAGFEAYFVGGSVRDAILGRPIHDVDIATSSYPQETKMIFPRTIDVGIEHGTVLVLENKREYEITTFRTEEVYVDFRRPSQVSFVRSLEEDLKRRDFTVNAFALNEEGDIIDLFHGLTDLEQGILRAVGEPIERFQEDALRIMRGFRFAASLDFDIEERTFEAMKDTAPLLQKISIERIFIEFDKLLLSDNWKKGLRAMIDSHAYNYLPKLEERGEHLEHLLTCLSDTFSFTCSEQAFTMLLVAIGLSNSKAFLKKWKTSNDFQRKVTQLLEIYDYRKQGILNKQIAYQYGKEYLELVEELRQAQGLPVDFQAIVALDQALTIHDRHEIVVNGGFLMHHFSLKPGPILGDILKKIEYEIVEGNLANKEEAILDYVKGFLKNE